MQVQNRKTINAHRALSQYIRPRLIDNARADFTKLFHGLDDTNIGDHIEQLIGGVIRTTAGNLAYDASPTELRDKLKKVVDEPDGTAKSEEPQVDENIVAHVLKLLEARLTMQELLAVKRILMSPPKRQSYDPGNQLSEDAAQVAYDARFPSAARIKIEPTCRPEPQRETQSSPSDYAKRWPNAMRIGQA
ncbi:MAG: hypothetical protein AB7F41_04885 [Methylocystis sp.]|uniref:hypothetical protein n=1 Tax=Methylocystis sp. TaxID=1911079 RepID=UPI003D0FFD04